MLVVAGAGGRRPWPEEQAATALGSPVDVVDPAGLGEATLLAPEDVAIDSRLQAVLEVGEGVEAEVEEALTVSLADGVGGEESQQALAVVRMGLAEQASERPEESHLAQLSAQQACLWTVWWVVSAEDAVQAQRSMWTVDGCGRAQLAAWGQGHTASARCRTVPECRVSSDE